MPMLLAPFALVMAAQAGAPPQSPPSDGLAPLPMAQQTTLRCSVAMAMAAQQQREGRAEDAGWPPLGERGREFFVRGFATLMDEAGLTRADVTERVRLERAELDQPGVLRAVMPGCLILLEASGL